MDDAVIRKVGEVEISNAISRPASDNAISSSQKLCMLDEDGGRIFAN
jgi:hypothetical protein